MRGGNMAKAILAAATVVLILSSCAPAKSPPESPKARIKEAAKLLDSWGGEPGTLEKAYAIIIPVLRKNPNDYLALKEIARYEIKSGYISSRDVSYNGHIHSVGNYTPGTLSLAEANLKHAFSVNPRFAEGYVLLAYIQYQQGLLDQAEKSLVKAEQLRTDDPWLQLNWARVEAARGNYPAANIRAQKVLDSKTADHGARAAAYRIMIGDYKNTADYDKVAKFYEGEIAENPNDAWMRGNYASFLNCTVGRNDEAIKQARTALAIMDYPMGRRILALALYGKWADLVAQGDAKKGEEYFREASRINRHTQPDLDYLMAYGASEPAGGRLAMALVQQKHVSIDAPAEDGSTALLIATNRNSAPAVRTLLELHANPNIPDRNGWTPLLSAADEGNEEIVKLLLSHGADIHATLNGSDAAMLAERGGHRRLAAELKAHVGR